MKVGSLVVVLKIPPINNNRLPLVKWLPIDDGNTPHVVREITVCGATGKTVVMFEEGVIGINPSSGLEFGINIEYVKEIQGPSEVDVEAIVEESIYVLV